jgi:hypothetical protein
MSQLLESILDKNFVLAESLFQERINTIMEKKLYEKKRMVAADMNEALGGLSPEEIASRKKSGYRKASDVLGDPREAPATPKRKAPPKTEIKPKNVNYAGAGNTPSAMYGRLKQHISKKAKEIKDRKPSAPGSGTLKVAKGVGRGLGKIARFIASDIAASI